MGDIFDQVNPQNPPNQNPQQPNPVQSTQPVNAGAGDIFDQVNPPNGQQPTQPNPSSQSPQSQPSTPTEMSPVDVAIRSLGPGSVAQGFAKGTLETGHTIGRLINKATGDKIQWLPTSVKDDKLEAHGAGETIGKMGEGLAEFVLGDEALKGMSIAEKLGIAQKVTDLAKSYPTLAKLISFGMNAARGSTIGGITGGLHGGASGAAIGATMGGATEAVGSPEAKQAASTVWDTITGKAIQSKLQTAIRSVLGDTAETANAGHLPAGELRESANTLADNLQSQAKALYKKIDDATQGEFTNIQGKIKNVENRLRDIAGTDDEAEERLYNQKVALNVRMDEAIEAAKKAGVNPSIADDARNTWHQMSALRDVDSQIKAAMPGAKQVKGEVVDPTAFANRVQKLYDSGRLQAAVGGKNARQMLTDARSAVQSSNRLQTARTVGKAAVKIAGYGAGASVGAKLLDVERIMSGR